jgi:hypothetical protein
MRKLLFLLSLAVLAANPAPGQDSPAKGPSLPPGQTQADYNNTIERRTDDILKPLHLTDPARTARVHEAVVAQYRALKSWHGENDARLKSLARDTNAVAEIRGSLKVIHDRFLAQLAADLTPAQVDQVKDQMVYNKVQVTYDAYCAIIPTLTAPQKAHILAVLQEAREEAMDGGSVNEKSAVFKKYKGRIANYLAKEGVNEAQFRKEWSLKQETRSATNAAPQE